MSFPSCPVSRGHDTITTAFGVMGPDRFPMYGSTTPPRSDRRSTAFVSAFTRPHLGKEGAVAPNNPSTVPYLCGGEWRQSTTALSEVVWNPSTGLPMARAPLCTAEEVNHVVQAAANALGEWSHMPVVERARFMFRLHGLMERDFHELTALVTREHGKTLAESSAELKRGLEIVEFCCGIPSLIAGEFHARIAGDVDGETARHPVGVCVGITPYNFPSMVPLWMFPIAITCGNTFVLKPSEKVPLSAIRLGELLLEAGLPQGVFNIVHGDRECVQALLTHPRVKAVSFVGSTEVARQVFQTASQHGKRVQAAGGAKNHLVIMPDAEVDLAVQAVAASAFGCAGQRCMAGSVAVGVGSIADALVEQLCLHGQTLTVGPTERNPDVGMGPLINPDALQRVEQYLQVAEREGACVRLDGRERRQEPGFVIGPSVVDHVRSTMRMAREEIFGPVLSVIRAGDLEEAIAIGEQSPYGNGASIFTRDGRAAWEFKQRFNAGMIGINVGVPAPMAWLPFSGWNESFFGDLHMQGMEGIQFYTRQKTTLTRWFRSPQDSPRDPVWK